MNIKRRWPLVIVGSVVLIIVLVFAYTEYVKSQVLFAPKTNEYLLPREFDMNSLKKEIVSSQSDLVKIDDVKFDYDPTLCNRTQDLIVTAKANGIEYTRTYSLILTDKSAPIVEEVDETQVFPKKLRLEEIEKYFNIYDMLVGGDKNILPNKNMNEQYIPGVGGYFVAYQGETNPAIMELHEGVVTLYFTAWDGFGNYTNKEIKIDTYKRGLK